MGGFCTIQKKAQKKATGKKGLDMANPQSTHLG